MFLIGEPVMLSEGRGWVPLRLQFGSLIRGPDSSLPGAVSQLPSESATRGSNPGPLRFRRLVTNHPTEHPLLSQLC